MAKWESEFNQLMSSQRDEINHDYGAVMQETWENGIRTFPGTTMESTGLQFDSEGIPILREYTFGNMVVISRFSAD